MYNLDMSNNRQSGFTIVELLIVIVVLVIIAGFVLSSYRGAQAQARDTVRIVDFSEIEKSLFAYYQTYEVYPCGDANLGVGYTHDGSGSEPFIDMDGSSAPSNCDTTIGPETGLYSEGLFPDQWRKDPINEVGAHLYWYVASPNRKSYLLYTRLEQNTDEMLNDGGLCNNYYESRKGPEIINLPATTQSYAFKTSCN